MLVYFKNFQKCREGKTLTHLKKKEFNVDAPTFTKDAEDYWINKLSDKGELIDNDEWELISEEECGNSDDEQTILSTLNNVNLAYGNYANGDKSSNLDVGLYKFGQVQEYDPFEQFVRTVVD